MPHYFIVKIDKEKQKERKEKIGSLYVHTSHTFMQRNQQNGEIIAIGEVANKKFPEAKIGDILLFHHFVEGAEKEKSNLIYSNETCNFYNVTASDFNGHRTEAYGIYVDGKIIPHPDFVFIEPEVKEKEISAKEFIEQNTKQVGSLILFTNWEETREDKEAKAARLTQEIKDASKAKILSENAKVGLLEKQQEAEKVTASISKQQYVPYKIAWINKKTELKNKVYALSLAAQTELDFNDRIYLIVNSKYCVAVA